MEYKNPKNPPDMIVAIRYVKDIFILFFNVTAPTGGVTARVTFIPQAVQTFEKPATKEIKNSTTISKKLGNAILSPLCY
ncbi:hypothetical protein [Alkalibacillus silvisoli]|uniref:hypothetical protein n=1 Tax=Alkalibacillus silvisoli TaxID=392823 RepID=UPI0031DE04A4